MRFGKSARFISTRIQERGERRGGKPRRQSSGVFRLDLLAIAGRSGEGKPCTQSQRQKNKSKEDGDEHFLSLLRTFSADTSPCPGRSFLPCLIITAAAAARGRKYPARAASLYTSFVTRKRFWTPFSKNGRIRLVLVVVRGTWWFGTETNNLLLSLLFLILSEWIWRS